MINKRLLKVFKEIQKLDNLDLELLSHLNEFQVKILKELLNKKYLNNDFIFNSIKRNLSRAQKYRSYNELIKNKTIYKKSLKTFLTR